ncbi:hypothetical protein V6Z11_D08G087700 [Gossypium hirsutum]
MKLEEVMDLELGCGQYGIIIMNRSSISFCLFFPPQLKRQPCRRGFSGLAGSESLDSAKSPLRHLFRTVGSYVRFSAGVILNPVLPGSLMSFNKLVLSIT